VENQARQSILLFDGDCNLCHWLVSFFSRRNRKKKIRFVAFQSSEGEALAGQYRLEIPATPESVILIDGQQIFQASDAVLELFRRMPNLYPVLYGLKIVPRALRDPIYHFIARNRFRWFGKKESCST